MKPFTVKVRDSNGKEQDVKYGLKESLVEVLFQPALKLNMYSVLKQEEIAKMIIDSGDELLLEDADYNAVKNALEKIEGLGRKDVEMVRRIKDAEQIKIGQPGTIASQDATQAAIPTVS